jgi:hypothetical protein
MKFVPFTVHVRVVPVRPGKRFEHLKDLSKLAVLAYEAIAGISGVNVSTPGGGQNIQLGDPNRRSALGSYAQGTAAKPQIGQAPAQLMLMGYYQSEAANSQTYADQQRISGGEIYTGPGQHSNDAMPSTTLNAEVKALKTALEAALTSGLPAGAEYSIFRLDYSGVVFGDKGFHFPR